MKKILSIALMLLLSTFITFGQTPTGSLKGVVSTADGVVPNATITLKFASTGKTQTATSDEQGAFSFVQLEPGNYSVTVSANGFKTFIANDVKIDVGREYNFTPTLEIGSIQENVTVTAGVDLVSSTSSQISTTISPQQILSLPLITRNPLNLTTLQAGVQSNPSQLTTINGMRTTATNTTRDGISINDPFIRANATDFAPGRPSVDDTGEFTISTGNQEADLGSGGAQIILVTPRGTTSYHGALFAYNRNSAFGANNFFSNKTGVALPFRNRNQYGGKFSGTFPTPVFGEGGPTFHKNKGFFFISYEGIRDPFSARATRTILQPAARTGAFNFNRVTAGAANSICPTATAGSLCTIPNILAFATAQGLPGIPATIDPIIQSRILALLPTAGNTTGGDTLNTTGYGFNRSQKQALQTYSNRFDYDATERDSFSLVYNWNKEQNDRPDVDNQGFDPIPDVTQGSTNEQVTVSYRRAFSSNIVNEVRWGRFKNLVPFVRTSSYPSFNLGTSGTTNTNLLAGLIDSPANVFVDQGRQNRVTTIADNLNWNVGKHSLKFGGQYQKYEVQSYNDAFTIPFYNIGVTNSTTLTPGNFTSVGGISGTQLGTANGLLALLGGLVPSGTVSYNQDSITSPFARVRQRAPFLNWNHSLYASDRWSIARGLTISLGVRYELFPALKLESGLALEPVLANLDDPAATLLSGNGTYNIVGTNSGKEYTFYKTDYNNFAPSFGVAWAPNFESGVGRFIFGSEGKSVIRGGYSQAFFNDSIITTLNNTLTSGGTGNFGLGRSAVTVINLNDRISGTLTNIPAPTFTPPPRSFLQNNAAQNNFGNAGTIDPNLQIPMVAQYSVGFQREFGGNMAIEVRYVGTSSENLARGYNLNEIQIPTAFLADFKRAQANLAVTTAINPATATAFCDTAVVVGCQALSIFRLGAIGTGPLVVGGAAITNAVFNAQLRNGTVANTAQLFVTNNLNNHPTLASPNNVPFVSFYRNPNIGQIELFTNAGSYNYNSLQFEFRRRFSKGLYFQANYTFSKNLTNAVGTDQANNNPFLQNSNRELDYSRADFDQTHTFNVNAIYQLPFGKGKMFLNQGGIVDKIIGGWEISGLAQWATGAPITILDGRGTINTASGRQTPNSTLTNDQIQALQVISEVNGNIYWINPSILNATGQASPGYITPSNPNNVTFAGQVFFNPAEGTTGNMGRAIFNGPRTFNMNAALLKNVTFTESMRVQLRMEAFNVLNNTNFLANTQFPNITSTLFGRVTAAGAARSMQFAFRFEF